MESEPQKQTVLHRVFGINFESASSAVFDSSNSKSYLKTLREIINKNTLTAVQTKELAEEILNRVCDIFLFKKEDLKRITDLYSRNVFTSQLQPEEIMEYLHYRNVHGSYRISYKTYRTQSVKNTLTIDYYLFLLKHLMTDPIIAENAVGIFYNEFDELVKKILEEILDIFNAPDEHSTKMVSPNSDNTTTENKDNILVTSKASLQSTDVVTLKQKMQIADMMILQGKKQQGYDMLNIIRERERELFGNGDTSYANITVYSDSQNAHNESINESVMTVCLNLLEKYGTATLNQTKLMTSLKNVCLNNEKEEYLKLYNNSEVLEATNERISKILNRIRLDPTLFVVKNNNFYMHNILACVVEFIERECAGNSELYEILIDELFNMEDFCTTGHISRLISVIQGFTTDDKLTVTISEKDQTTARMINFLSTKGLEDAPDEVMDTAGVDTSDKFAVYCCQQLNNFLLELYDEYVDDFIKKNYNRLSLSKTDEGVGMDTSSQHTKILFNNSPEGSEQRELFMSRNLPIAAEVLSKFCSVSYENFTQNSDYLIYTSHCNEEISETPV